MSDEENEHRDFARYLRQQMNEFERCIWKELRGRRLRRLKFRRQHPLGPYTADYWCPAVRVVVELDGFSHRERLENDRARDAWMAERGILVLRFKNSDIELGTSRALKIIAEACEARMKK